jgi:hypothetical protein
MKTLKEQAVSDLAARFNKNLPWVVEAVYKPAAGGEVSTTLNVDETCMMFQSPEPPGDNLEVIAQKADVLSPDNQGDSFIIDGATWYLVKHIPGASDYGTWRLLLSRSARRML